MTSHDQQEQVKQSVERLAERSVRLSIDEMEAMVGKASKEALEDMLQRLGIDASNPLSAQQDFAKLRAMRKLLENDDFLADLAFMRRWRLNSQRIADTGISTGVRWLIVGGLGILILLTKDWWMTHVKG